MLLTSIPYFREVIVVSFRCEHCGNTNNEIQSAGEIRRELHSMPMRWLTLMT
jgi:zinc finger protein